MQDLICQAIVARRVIMFNYDGFRRTVEPHQLGYSKNRDELKLSGYQTEGGSESGGIPDWRFFILAEIRNLTVSNAGFQVRDGYRPAPNKRIANAICEV